MTQRLVILGAGTALPDADRDNTSLVWDSPSGSLLIDCGGRAYQQLLRAGVDPLGLRGVLLTHNHTDHIYGLPALLFHLWLAEYRATLGIWANPSTLAMARKLVDALDLERAEHMCAVAWHELPETQGYEVLETNGYRVLSTPVEHSRPTLGVRIENRETGGALAYSADTEPCASFEALARGVQLVIHEATVAQPGGESRHSTPSQAGAVAAAAGAERLVLIHYSALYTMPESEALAQAEGTFSGQVELARELAEYFV